MIRPEWKAQLDRLCGPVVRTLVKQEGKPLSGTNEDHLETLDAIGEEFLKEFGEVE
jgi:hypothetical protein